VEDTTQGFFDTYGERAHLLVTGSSRMDIYRRGGDSLMGRYMLYRMHPWSVGECLRTEVPKGAIHAPRMWRPKIGCAVGAWRIP